ncbi:hypothetical protein ACIBBG_33350 [Micromonospora chersina]|uniref:hypothetical protein n=1 Tax=Micromonospora chersina TaxID=47854 RepID=UPI0037A0AED0
MTTSLAARPRHVREASPAPTDSFQAHDYSQEACLKRGLVKLASPAAGPQLAQVIFDGTQFAWPQSWPRMPD